MPNCTNCNTEIESNFCPNCGQPATLKRINAHYIVHEIEHVLHFERGILHTVKELMIRPGKNVRQYLSENRSRLVKPIIFIIVTSLIYSLANNLFHVEEQYLQYTETKGLKDSTTGKLMGWVQAHYGYGNIIMGMFIALWLQLFFRKGPYNFFEVLILQCFVIGITMLLLTVGVVIQGTVHIQTMQAASVVMLVYYVWAVGDFLPGKKAGKFFKVFFAFLLGSISFFAILMLIGAAVDSWL